MPFTAAEIAKHLNGEVAGDGSIKLTGFAPAEAAQAGDLTFAENDDYLTKAEQSAASAVLVSGEAKSKSKVLIRVANPRAAFARVLPLFFPEPELAPGIHPSAVVAASAQVDSSAHIGPLCLVGERVKIGPRCILHGSVSIGADCSLGEEVQIRPNVTLYARTQLGHRVRIHAGAVIGADGFGYVFDQGQHLKVPQVGHVIIHDDVEIGANVAIDRGALGPTIIGRGTKIDNLVQIGHNVVVGEHCILCGQVGVSGSTKLGNYVTLAGQVGLAGSPRWATRSRWAPRPA
jgi:UDP-3-O-[3-hydroxymyristoyl] glucosamine N-acyltransferase